MTCIAALIHNNEVWMGGDSAGVAGLNVTVRKDPKVFKNGEFLIGFTSSFRMGQLLRYRFNPPRYYEDDDVYAYMCTDFIEELRYCLKAGGYATRINEEESGGNFLVGFKGRLFEIGSDFQVGESIAEYNAVGCGEEYAKGSLFSMMGINSLAEDKLSAGYIIEEALKAAEYFSGGVRSPFIIEKI